MKNRNIFGKLGDFVLGKGFYIVLALCIATIGVSGYYLLHRMSGQPQEMEPVGGDTTVVLPDSEANGPDPAGSLSAVQLPEPKPKPQPPAPKEDKQPDDPQPEKKPAEKPQTPKPVVYTWPVKGEILRDFSVETLALDPTLGDWRTHGGLDIAASQGLQVLAMGSGTVAEVYEDGLMGTTVVIDHGNGLTSACRGLAAQPTVQEGDTVETGDIIGGVGNTAIAESGMPSHLHLETWLNNEPVSPLDYLPEN